VEFASPAAGDRILDICCGTGELTAKIISRGFAGKLVGVDISEPAIDIARTKYRSVTFLRASADDLPFSSSRFDKGFISFGLHHMSKQVRRKTLMEIHRTLAPGGALYVIEYSLPEKGLRRLAAITFAKLDESDEAYEMLKTGSLDKEMEQAGFEVEKRVLTCQDMVQLLKVVKK